jgi:PIN domain nuclease of toxin-antitoxin system
VIVLDASALLAFLLDEPGGDVVEAALESGEAICSSVNWSEVAQKSLASGRDWDEARLLFFRYVLTIEPVVMADAEVAAQLWPRHQYLSLGDRLCLAVAHRLGASVLTADRAWGGLDGVTLIR